MEKLPQYVFVSVSIELNVMMDGSVKLFQATRRFHMMGGFYPPQPHQIHPISFKNLQILIGLIFAFFGVSGYFIFLATNMFDYTISFYASVTTLFFITIFCINIWKTANIYELWDLGERLLEKSKWLHVNENDQNHTIMRICFCGTGVQNSTSKQNEYAKLIKIIEYICELFFLALMKISIPSIMGCALAVTLVNYYVFDLGEDAYYLPFPTMYA